MCRSSAEGNGRASELEDYSSIQLRAIAKEHEQGESGRLAAVAALGFFCLHLGEPQAGLKQAEEVIRVGRPLLHGFSCKARLQYQHSKFLAFIP